MTVKEFLILSEVASNPGEIRSQIEALEKPTFIRGKRTPETLESLTMGRLIELQSIEKIEETLFIPCSVLLDLSRREVLECSISSILGFTSWVSKEVKKISNLFASTSVKPSIEEVSAGINDLSFGLFGIIDWYALRMGITDHTEVERVPWVRVYKCLDMDAKKIRYERRLREIYQNKK